MAAAGRGRSLIQPVALCVSRAEFAPTLVTSRLLPWGDTICVGGVREWLKGTLLKAETLASVIENYSNLFARHKLALSHLLVFSRVLVRLAPILATIS